LEDARIVRGALLVYRALGHIDGASVAAERALALNPDDDRAW